MGHLPGCPLWFGNLVQGHMEGGCHIENAHVRYYQPLQTIVMARVADCMP